MTDASNVLLPLDIESAPRIVQVKGSEKNLRLSEVRFFCIRKNVDTQFLGTLSLILSNHYTALLRSLIVQEEPGSNKLQSTTVDLSIAALYYTGIHVRKDEEYARSIISSLDSLTKEQAMTEILSCHADVTADTLIAQALMDFGADPSQVHPLDDRSPLDVARSYNNHNLVHLFESKINGL